MSQLIDRKRKTNKTVELYLTPVLNIFLNIIPLLLVTTVFVQTSVINLSLPSQPAAGSASAQAHQAEKRPERKREQFLILSISAKGFYLILGDKLLKIIPKGGNNYDFDKLEAILRKVKKAFPEQESIIIESEDDIIYDHLIHTMDRCRACGLVDIILSASKS